jgi:thiamine pyrophosphate-dependent acetolactate synthase large subunit-like protein
MPTMVSHIVGVEKPRLQFRNLSSSTMWCSAAPIDSLVNHLGNEKPQMIVVLHEEHAVAIAHGYAKVTGKPLGAILHSNVGLMHDSMAIFDAWVDRIR